MTYAILNRLGPHYILATMIATRLFGSVGGLLVIYYVELTLNLPPIIRQHFHVASIVVVVFSCTVTVVLALWETRHVRHVLSILHRGHVPTSEQCRQAANESIRFAGIHHLREAWVVPLTTLVPVLIYLRVVDDASIALLWNISIAVFMGIAMALMSTYFAVTHGMQPVIIKLLDQCDTDPYDNLPSSRLSFRFGLCSTLIVMTTALMIGTLASQRASQVLHESDRAVAQQALITLRRHTVFIMVAAVILGTLFSTVLASSVTSRISRLVYAMERVRHGKLSLRVRPTGTDEVDRLARQFNDMLVDLEQSNQTIRDLNQNLERRVETRTRELEQTLIELQETQSQLTDMAHSAGMAEIATGVLHNVGNLLNSVNISVAMVTGKLRSSKIVELERLTARLDAQDHKLSEFLSTDDRAEKLLEYLHKLTDLLREERDQISSEVEQMTIKVDNVKGVIAAQQNYARAVSFREDVDLERLIKDVLAMHGPSFVRHKIEVVTKLDAVPPVWIEKNKAVQILDNLVRNAVESMRDAGSDVRRLTVSLSECEENQAWISVADTGGGIDAGQLDQIFNYGYTTKRDGHGFGLHSAALAVNSLGGKIVVSSGGIGKGATFTLHLPLAPEDFASKGSLSGSMKTPLMLQREET